MKNTSTSPSQSPTVAAAKDAVSTLKENVSTTTDSLTSGALDQAANKKADAADGIDRMSGALHQTAEGLESKDPNIAHFAHQIADKLDGASNYLRNRSLSALQEDAGRIARDHPVAFFGGLFAAGIVLGSIIKASVSAAAPPEGDTSNNSSQGNNSSSNGNRNVSQSPSGSQS